MQQKRLEISNHCRSFYIFCWDHVMKLHRLVPIRIWRYKNWCRVYQFFTIWRQLLLVSPAFAPANCIRPHDLFEVCEHMSYCICILSTPHSIVNLVRRNFEKLFVYYQCFTYTKQNDRHTIVYNRIIFRYYHSSASV